MTALALSACNGLLGIEELHEGPNPSAGGAAGSGATGGVATSRGGATATGSGGKLSGSGGESMSGGSLGAGGSPGDAGSGGDGGDASGGVVGSGGTNSGGTNSGGTNSGGKANTGGAVASGGKASGGAVGSGGASSGGKANTGGTGSGGTSSTTVSGTLIDLWGHPLPNVPVTIGTVSKVTDASGKFSFPNVTDKYDVTAVVSPSGREYAWIYQGLTRRDPTLQVYRGLEDQDANPNIKPTGASDQTTNAFAWGCPDGSSAITFGAGGVTSLGALSWFGPVQTSGAYHVLAFKRDAKGYPTEYSTYLTAPLTVAANSTVLIPLAFTNTPLTTSTIGGTVTPAPSGSRANYLFARFADNAVVPIADPSASTAQFSFVAPVLDGAQIAVAASDGSDSFYGPFAIAHKNAALGSTTVALSVPTTPVQLVPSNNPTNVGSATHFSWVSATDTVYVMHVESSPYYRGMFIVTAARDLQLPNVGGAFFLNKNELHWWQVEVHGTYASVDQVARPGGFFDSFAYSRTEPDFYRAQDDGYFAVSQAYSFTTAP